MRSRLIQGINGSGASFFGSEGTNAIDLSHSPSGCAVCVCCMERVRNCSEYRCETNCAPTSTYTYTGPPLKILNQNPISNGCPTEVGNVNAVLTGAIAAQCTPTGGPMQWTPTGGTCVVGNYSLPLTLGPSYLQISGLGGNVTKAGAVCDVSSPVILGPSAIGTVYDQASNYGADNFTLYLHLPCAKCGGGYQVERCDYSSNTPGAWTGPFVDLFSAKNLGSPAQPLGPEAQPTSPANVLVGEIADGPTPTTWVNP